MDKTHMKEVGLPTLLFPAAKIALFIAMYKVSWWGGEECSIHNASASCLVYFFPVCGKSLIVLFLITLSSILFSHQVLAVFSVHTTSPASEILAKLSAAVSFPPNDSDMKTLYK